MIAPQIFTIPLLPLTANQRERAHWRTLAKEKDDWTLMIPMCADLNRQHLGEAPRMVEVVFSKTRGPESDPDGLPYRCKSIMDALVRRGWLYDDSPTYCQLEVREETRAPQKQTTIAISKAISDKQPWREVVYGDGKAA